MARATAGTRFAATDQVPRLLRRSRAGKAVMGSPIFHFKAATASLRARLRQYISEPRLFQSRDYFRAATISEPRPLGSGRWDRFLTVAALIKRLAGNRSLCHGGHIVLAARFTYCLAAQRDAADLGG